MNRQTGFSGNWQEVITQRVTGHKGCDQGGMQYWSQERVCRGTSEKLTVIAKLRPKKEHHNQLQKAKRWQRTGSVPRIHQSSTCLGSHEQGEEAQSEVRT